MIHLYKYIADPDSISHFLSGRVKFTPINELNDPSELTTNINAEKVKESLERIRSQGYSANDLLHLQKQAAVLKALAPNFQAIEAPRNVDEANKLIRSAFYDQTDVLIQLLSKTTNEISEKVGIFCLSKRYNSLPMWAHYAANATGAVIEFAKLDEFFLGDETGVLQQPIDVRYNRETGGVTFDPKSHDAIFFEKYSDWSYEQEVRVIVPLEQCENIPLDGGKRLYTLEIPPTIVSRVILGWNMDSIVSQRIIESSDVDIPIDKAEFTAGKVNFR